MVYRERQWFGMAKVWPSNILADKVWQTAVNQIAIFVKLANHECKFGEFYKFANFAKL